HPAILRALAQPQSATSLRRLLRDPQGYVWRYALEWRETMPVAPPLDLQPRIFGDLVHLLLQRTVAALEPLPGFGRAAQHEVEAALAAASERIFAEWPLERATPPSLLWRYTLAEAGSVALRALQLDPPFQPGTRSWTEVRFGEVDGRQPDAGAPWDHREPVPVPGTGLTIRGAIDRLELDSGDRNARVTDYKSGTPPRQPGRVALGRGMELQRVLYAVAVARHRPETNIIARLVYLTEEQPGEYKLRGEALDTAIGTAARHLNAAVALIQAGTSLPGPDDSWEVWNELRLALPAAGEPFRQVKQQAFLQAFGEFAAIWRAQ
ncbi:MAG: hypothetical protein JWR80_2686, partial [Bradyrhizobium sp.]|nr:hypothetical protein [Bradyrhizobium sp.]